MVGALGMRATRVLLRVTVDEATGDYLVDFPGCQNREEINTTIAAMTHLPLRLPEGDRLTITRVSKLVLPEQDPR